MKRPFGSDILSIICTSNVDDATEALLGARLLLL